MYLNFSLARAYHQLMVGLAVILISTMAWAWPVLGFDDIPWEFQTTSPFLAIGDLHGDVEALRFILEQNHFIVHNGKWTAESSHLLLNGDLFNRGPHSFKLVNFVMALQEQAAEQGGHVHVILGNHEVMIAKGKLDMLSPEDQRDFAKSVAPNEPYSFENLRRAFMADSKYAKWMRSLNSIVKINEVIFTHAGLGEWALDTDVGAINSTARAWMEYFQRYRLPDLIRMPVQPPIATQWVVAPETGPMWTAEMNDERSDKTQASQRLSPEMLQRIFIKLRARFLGLAHVLTFNNRIVPEHIRYGDSVFQMDTGISRAYGGLLSAVLFVDGKIQTWHSQRPNFSASCSNIL